MDFRIFLEIIMSDAASLLIKSMFKLLFSFCMIYIIMIIIMDFFKIFIEVKIYF